MKWKALPSSLDGRGCAFVAEMRRLKDHSGLSLASLQAKTAFSVSSWERYLNGVVLPPEEAVTALARVAGGDAAALLALRAEAGRTWRRASGAGGAGPPDAAADAPGGGPERVRVGGLAAVAGALLCSAAVSLLLVLDAPPPAAGTAGASRVGRYPCHYVRHGDLLYAGNSATGSRRVVRNSTGPDAAEVQCLLLRHGLSPGDVDGYFGPRTEAEVERLQRQDHVPDDGIVGAQTWALLRHVE